MNRAKWEQKRKKSTKMKMTCDGMCDMREYCRKR